MSRSRPQRNSRVNTRVSGYDDDWQQNLQPSPQQIQQQRQRQQPQPKQHYHNPSPPPMDRHDVANVNFLPASQSQLTVHQTPLPEPPQPPQLSNEIQESVMDTLQSSENGFQAEEEPNQKFPWKKGKGVVKLSAGERRRRRNKRLSKVLIPKTALVVLNECNNSETRFTVEPVSNGAGFGDTPTGNSQYVATLTSGGNEYKGFALSKVSAKNDAAEQAIRDWMLKRMDKLSKSLGNTATGNEDDPMDTADGTAEEDDEDDDMPILSMASFALHKLYLEWQADGFKIPNLNKVGIPQPNSSNAPSVAGSDTTPKTPKKKGMPADAARLHPTMLLGQLHPDIEYLELPPEGDKLNTIFVFSVTIDGLTFVGKGTNKKEARKFAARQACQEIHGVVYDVAT